MSKNSIGYISPQMVREALANTPQVTFQEDLNSAIDTRLLPIFNGRNEGFFDRNIFISKEDLRM